MKQNIRIEKLILSNYRNHKFLELYFKKNIILICGKNGSGKTNILESISLISSSAGLKSSSLKELINKDLFGPLELFGVNMQLLLNNKLATIGLGIKKSNSSMQKIIKINNKKYNERVSETFKVFWIVPKTIFLFQDSPESRRGFLDQMICSINNLYKNNLQIYQKYKKERIRLLKNLSEETSEWLDIIEKKIALTGVIICDERRNFIKNLNNFLKDKNSIFPSLFASLDGQLDKLLTDNPAISVEEIFQRNLKLNRKKDLLTGRTNFSANRTDFVIKNKESNLDAKNHSTGEQKVIIFSIIFSFIEFLEKSPDSKIIFLLDDVFSFLDQNYILAVLRKLNNLNVQTLLTDIRGEWIMKLNSFKSIVQKINIDD